MQSARNDADGGPGQELDAVDREHDFAGCSTGHLLFLFLLTQCANGDG